MTPLWLRPGLALYDRAIELIGHERRVEEANGGGVADRVGERGGDWIVGVFAHRFGPERADRVERQQPVGLEVRVTGNILISLTFFWS